MKKKKPFHKHTPESRRMEKATNEFPVSPASSLTPFLLLIASPFFAFLHLWTLHRPGSKSSQSCRNRGRPASSSCPSRYLTWFEAQKRLRLAQVSYTHAFWVFSIGNHGLCHESKNFSLKGQRVNILGFATHMVCHSHSFLSYCTKSHRTHTTEWVWLCPIKIWFGKKKSRQQAIVCNLWVILSHFYGKSGSIIIILTNKATCHMALSYVP